MEQALVCAPVTQRAQARSPVSTSFLDEIFSGFFSPVRQISGSFRHTRSPEYHLAVIIILPYFHIHLVTMNGYVNGVSRLSCSCCLGCDPGIELIHLSDECFHDLVWSKKYIYDPELIPFPDRSWLYKARVA